MVRRPSGAAVDPAIHLRKHAGQVAFSRRGRGQYRCLNIIRSASRLAGEIAIRREARGGDWRFTAGERRGFGTTPIWSALFAKSPGAPSQTEVSAVCLKCRWRKRCNWVDIIRLMFYRRGNSHRVWLSPV